MSWIKWDGGRIPYSLLIVGMLTVLYNGMFRIDPDGLQNTERDKFILNKETAGVALYAILAERDFLDKHHHLFLYVKLLRTILDKHMDIHTLSGAEAIT